MSLLSIFLTGLISGGLTCLAIQGGLLATSIATIHKDSIKDRFSFKDAILPASSFLITRLLAYTAFGIFLGAAGSFFEISLRMKIILQSAVLIFMIGTALNLLEIHPFFRYFAIKPPRFFARFIRHKSKSNSIFAPGILGAMTVFIPCGATQAMMAYAVSSQSAVNGALIMFSFILGTSPLFLIFGLMFRQAGGLFALLFRRVAAVLIIAIALYGASGTLTLSGVNIEFSKLTHKAYCMITYCPENNISNDNLKASSEVTIYFERSSYQTEPKTLAFKSGSKVKLNLVNKNGAGCIQAFTIPKLNIQTVVPLGKSENIEITVPEEKGELTFMCSMGMYSGKIKII